MNTFIGFDVSRSKSSFCVMNPENEEMSVKEFVMSSDEFVNFLKQTEELVHPAFLMESIDRYHLTLLQDLLNHGQETFIINPILINNYSKANTLSRINTDIVDAKLIADFGFTILRNSEKRRLVLLK